MTYSPTTSTAGLFDPERDGLRLDDYDYPLPEDLIARYPLPRRDQSRMLVVDRQGGRIAHHRFDELPHFLSPGDCMVLNNTKVLPVRFYGNRRGYTGQVELLLLHPAGNHTDWTALMRPARKLSPGTVIELDNTGATIEVLANGERGQGTVRLHPAEHGDAATMMAREGLMPIPPYLRRRAEESDKERYQTVFSKVPGAQAAPTAGLHFTPDVLQTIAERGVETAEVTLSVSAGTFRTVEEDDVRNHRMDPEAYTIPQEAADRVTQTRAQGGRILAVGTTVAKTLETSAHRHQGQVTAESGWSDLFIYPGFRFQVTDRLLTNFHLPKSTLLMLISAFADRGLVARAYEEALAREYRFFSYGDCMLIL